MRPARRRGPQPFPARPLPPLPPRRPAPPLAPRQGRRERVAYLSAQALAALEAYLSVRPSSPDDAVFLGRFGRRLSVTAIQRQLARYCQKAGLWLTCHRLRHTFGRHMVEAGMPVTSLQRLLGHARLRTTELYLHVSDTQVQADYQTAMAQVARRFPLAGGG